jgi:hypothetical protein
LADLLQVDKNKTAFIKLASIWQLAANLVTTCSRLVILKPEQAMRTNAS